MRFVHVKQQTHAAVRLLAKIAFVSMQLTETSAAVAALSNGRGSAGITICIVHASNHHDFAAHSSCRLAEVATKMGRRRVVHFQRLSISAIISSAQRTASAIARDASMSLGDGSELTLDLRFAPAPSRLTSYGSRRKIARLTESTSPRPS
jgi:hypothetical protein